MKNIIPIQIWVSGNLLIANVFVLQIVNDDLQSRAQLYYKLLNKTVIDETESFTIVTDGNLTIDGVSYQNWTNEPDVNEWIYNWSADQLNIEII